MSEIEKRNDIAAETGFAEGMAGDRPDRLSDEEKALIALIGGDSAIGQIPEEAVEEVEPTAQEMLLADMKKLAGIQAKINTHKVIQAGFNKSLAATAPQIVADLQKSIEIEKQAQKDYNTLKDDIVKRAEKLWDEEEVKNPCLGIVITENKNRVLTVDDEEAVQWCIENNYRSLLQLKRDIYANQLEINTLPDMPGSLDTTPVYKAKISIKPFERKEVGDEEHKG